MDQEPRNDDRTTLNDGMSADWKWRALFGDVRPAAAPVWNRWMAEAMHAEQLATLRHWAHRNDQAA
jgi:hypothetical protein